MSIYRLLKSMF